MASQHLAGPATLHLDGYLKGIRDEFERLNHELDETRKQRDEYITKYRSQVKELRELHQTISSRENNTVCQHGQHTSPQACGNDNSSPLISPISSLNEYNSSFDREDSSSDDAKGTGHLEGEREIDVPAIMITRTASLSLQANITPTNIPKFAAWDVEYNRNTIVALNLNLVHKLPQKRGIYVAFSMDGKYLATASIFGIVSIFDSKTGKRISVMKDLYHDEKSLPAYRCIGFSPDSKYLATGEDDGNVRIWVVSQRRVRYTFKCQDNGIHSLNFSPNGRFIVTCSFGRRAIIWRLRDGSSRVLNAPGFYPLSVRFSLDGRYVASGEIFGKLRMWDARTGKLVARWQGHSDLVKSLVFTLDGKGLLSGSLDNQIIQWDVSFLSSLGTGNPPIANMTEISCLIGHKMGVVTVSISPDGKWIASGSSDGTVRIWNAQEATLHCILHCPDWVSSVDFSPVGNCLAIAGDFEDVTIWNYVNS